MKFASVKFFKRLIVAVYVLLIVIPLAAAVVLGVLYSKEKHRADSLAEATFADIAALLENQEGENNPPLVMEGSTLRSGGPSFSYQSLYPHLYANPPLLQSAESHVCYLTFDDGPSEVTMQILDVLAKEDVQATFFVTGENSVQSEKALRAAAEAGHSIGVHSYSHDYEAIYASVEDYLADFNEMYLRIRELTGKPPEIFRFPGGSINIYNQQVYTAIIAEMTRRGFVFYDWNTEASDAQRGAISAGQITSNVLGGAAGKDRLIVLMHDRADNANTAAALPGIIEGLREAGYRFAPLTNTVEPITYYYTEQMQSIIE